MKTTTLILAVAALGLPAAALAASPFDGTWKTDPATTTFSGKPTVYLLKNGVFDCESCSPAFKAPADGMAHPFTGASGYVDSLKVVVVDPHTVRLTGLKAGKALGVQTLKVAPDGKTMTFTFASMMGQGDSTTHYVRVATGPAGSMPLSGTWRPSSESFSTNLATNVFKIDGGTVIWSSPIGQSYRAMLDGKAAPIKGDKGGTMAQVRKVSDHEIVETDWRDGKKVDVQDMTVSPDGRTMTVVDHQPQSGRTVTQKAHKV